MGEAPRGNGHVTIDEVAARAGVAKSTVSKYLTKTPYVSEGTASQIQKVIDELNYRPSARGRSLATGRSGFIGVVVASLLNPFYTELVERLDVYAGERDFSIMLGTADRDPAREHRIVEGLLQKGIDGLVLASAAMNDREVRALQQTGLPFVLVSRHLEGVHTDRVIVDNRLGARLAVRHLLSLRHERIAHICGPDSVLPLKERKQGYVEALRGDGVAGAEELLVGDSIDFDAGAEAVEILMALPHDRRPTAVFCGTDLLAFAAIAKAREIGVRIPEDLSVIGFDNVITSPYGYPPLTSVDGRTEEQARQGIELLTHRMTNASSPTQHVMLTPTLVVRGSTARLR